MLAIMSQIEIATVAYTVSADYLATVGADFDVEAVDDAILAQLNALVPAGVTVHRNGKAYADEDAVETARSIDWDELLSRIDVDQILADHGL
jgi:hypothetical protein